MIGGTQSVLPSFTSNELAEHTSNHDSSLIMFDYGYFHAVTICDQFPFQ